MSIYGTQYRMEENFGKIKCGGLLYGVHPMQLHFEVA